MIGEPWLIYIPVVAYIDIEKSPLAPSSQAAKRPSGQAAKRPSGQILRRGIYVYHDRVLLLRHSVHMNPVTQQFRDAYAPDELAKILKVKTSTVYAWISRGELQSNKTGYSRSISSAQLHNFIASRNSGKYNFALEHIR